MKRRNMKKRIIAQLMAAGLLTASIPWVPTDMVNATTTSEDSQTSVENQAGEAQQSLEDTTAPENTETGNNSENDKNTDASGNSGTTDNSGNTDSSEAAGNSESTGNSEKSDTDANTTTDTDTTDTETIADPTPGSNARGVMEQPVSNARYDGITIDGDFSDWDAVAKYDVNQSGLDQTAMVWDGDMIYLYFMTLGNENGNGNWNEVAWSGPNSNGNFAITTDLGNTLKFQLCNDGTVAGVDGASAAVNNKEWGGAPHMWEVSIPSSALPAYKNTISLGYYAADTLISDVANLKGDSSSDTGNGSGTDGNTGTDSGNASGITIDGNYGDWENYPHNLIQYSTNGSHDSKPDGEAALYMSDGTLYAHVRTEMQSHLSEAGGEFTQGVTIRLNGKHDFYPQFVTVDANGNVNAVSSLSGLEKGTYEVYLIDSQGWQVNGVSLSALMADDSLDTYHNAIYGHMYMTIGASKDDMEFSLDLGLVAQKFGMDADDIKTVEAQWGRIGPQWVSAAGTSTGTWLGLLICFAAVGISAQAAKRKKRIAG